MFMHVFLKIFRTHMGTFFLKHVRFHVFIMPEFLWSSYIFVKVRAELCVFVAQVASMFIDHRFVCGNGLYWMQCFNCHYANSTV